MTTDQKFKRLNTLSNLLTLDHIEQAIYIRNLENVQRQETDLLDQANELLDKIQTAKQSISCVINEARVND